jgi:photosystem II stability/assembly factor-like uncharacterized protein
MKTKGLLLFIMTFISFMSVNAQELTWRTLSGAPVGAPSYPKIVDCSFINENTGWLVMIENSVGKAYKTVNGGYNWTLRYSLPGKTFRSVAFLNEDIIIIGTLNNSIHRSTNGGDNWSVVHTTSAGICGLFSPDGQTVYGCGRYYSPARFYRSTNQGANWTETNMSSYAFGLVDLYFYSLDSGYVIGGKGTSLQTSKSVVLFTSDGGDTWEERFVGAEPRQWGWKIQFPSRDTGYASVEKAIFLSDSIPAPYLKTTDGGITWIEKAFLTIPYDQEGIGFINNNTGWLGGWGDDDNGPTYKTTDGGDSWVLDDWSRNFNRFRFINDSVSYAVGKTVYKYSKDSTVGISIVSSEIPSNHTLFQNYPNPFNPSTKIKFSITTGDDNVSLKVFDLNGKKMSVVAFGKFQPGTYEVAFDGSALPSGVYFYELTAGEYKEVKKMVLIK